MGFLGEGAALRPPAGRRGMCSGLGLAVGLCCVVGDGDKRVVPASFPWDVAGLPGLCGSGALETCWAFAMFRKFELYFPLVPTRGRGDRPARAHGLSRRRLPRSV